MSERRPILGFSRYEIDAAGSVWRIGAGPVSPQPTHNGYQAVKLRNDGGRRVWRKVHVLVLESFVGPRPSPRHHGAHGPDRDRTNNCVSNLRWATPEENEADKRLHGSATGGQGIAASPPQRVRWIRKRAERGESLTQIAARYGMHRSSVSRIVRGHRHA